MACLFDNDSKDPLGPEVMSHDLFTNFKLAVLGMLIVLSDWLSLFVCNVP